MSYEFYKIIHILSVIFLFIALTAYAYSSKKSFSIGHGIALLLILVSGFGLLARLGLVRGFPNWVWVKFGVWLVLGAALALAKRKKLSQPIQISLWIALGGLAVFMAVTKPF